MILSYCRMLAGFLMDLLLGDPYWLPHPIRLIETGSVFWKRDFGSKTEEKHTTPEQEQKEGECCLYLQF